MKNFMFKKLVNISFVFLFALLSIVNGADSFSAEELKLEDQLASLMEDPFIRLESRSGFTPASYTNSSPASVGRWSDDSSTSPVDSCFLESIDTVVPVYGGYDLAELLALANTTKDGSELTPARVSEAARAMQKHSARGKTLFPKMKGSKASLNAACLEIVRSIIIGNVTSEIRVPSVRGRYGTERHLDFKDALGRGVRFTVDISDRVSSFVGFLEPDRDDK